MVRNFKVVILTVSVLLLAVLFWVFPPFTVKSLSERQKELELANFHAGSFVNRFWEEEMQPALSTAIPLDVLKEAFDRDPESALETYGHQVGVSSKSHFLIRVEGEVVKVDESGLQIQPAAASDVEVVISKGPLFGNTVRDATGLLDVNAFPDTMQFSEIADELNKRVEASVLKDLFEQVEDGQTIKLTGCISISNRIPSLDSIKLVPLEFELQ